LDFEISLGFGARNLELPARIGSLNAPNRQSKRRQMLAKRTGGGLYN
jgi:hypothetical protein